MAAWRYTPRSDRAARAHARGDDAGVESGCEDGGRGRCRHSAGSRGFGSVCCVGAKGQGQVRADLESGDHVPAGCELEGVRHAGIVCAHAGAARHGAARMDGARAQDGRRAARSAGAARSGRCKRHPDIALVAGLGRHESIQCAHDSSADRRAELRGLRPRVSSGRAQSGPNAAPRRNRRCTGRRTSVQYRRGDQGHGEAERVRDVVRALRFVGWRLGRDGQRHRHDRDDGGDADSEDSVSESRNARSSLATGAARSRG